MKCCKATHHIPNVSEAYIHFSPQLVLTDSGEVKVETHASSETQPYQAALLLPEASRTNVSEETLYNWQPCQRACARPARGITRARWDKDIPAGENLF